MGVVFAVLLAVDLILKYCEEAYEWEFVFIPQLITVESGVRNSGAAFSFLSNAVWGQTFLIVLTFIMLAALIFGFLVLPERFVLLKLAIAMVASGALGNLVDRLMFREVRDFVWVNMIGGWACCNFADFWIVFGVIIAILDMLFFNEWSAFPLTKKAKARVATREEKERLEKEENEAVSPPLSSDLSSIPQDPFSSEERESFSDKGEDKPPEEETADKKEDE